MNDKEKLSVPKPAAGDVAHAVVKGILSTVPWAGGTAAELLELVLAPPLSKRRDEWMETVAKRLQDVEANLNSLADDPAFVTTVLQATQIALRTHQEEKLEALRYAVVNSAIGAAPEDDLRAIFLNLVDAFTPTHLRILKYFQNRGSLNSSAIQHLRDTRAVTDVMVNELARDGLIEDQRPYAARGRDSGESLLISDWTLSKLGAQFIEFISSSSRGAAGTASR
jgi:hypothetical protein